MTVTEFSRMYNVNKAIVYNAAYRIPYAERHACCNDYNHDSLMKATIDELNHRIDIHKEKLNINQEYLNRLLKK